MRVVLPGGGAKLHRRVMTKQFLVFWAAVSVAQGAPTAAAISAFDAYIGQVEARLGAPQLFKGDIVIEQVKPVVAGDLAGAMLHHWRGTAFAPGAHAGDFERILRDFNTYPEYFAPQVTQAAVISANGDHVSVEMRVKQRHVMTVEMELTCDVAFGRFDELRRYSISRSSRITELGGEDHGFLWRLNTYWNYEERDGGVYLQIETVSMSRSVPKGLGWLIGPYVESIPRESIEFTLRCALSALLNHKGDKP